MSARRTVLTLAASAACGALAAFGAVACTDFDAPDATVLPDVVVANPSFTRDIMPIFDARCATSGCHTNTTRQSNFTLEGADSAHANLLRGRVNPANPNASFVVCVLRGPCGAFPRMPIGQPPLTDNQIQTIVNWIGQGAQKN